MNRSSNALAARAGLFVILASASLAVGGARSFTNTALTTGENPLPFESQAVDVETLHELWADIDSELDQLHQRIDDLEDQGGAVPGGGGGGGGGGIAGISTRYFSISGNSFQPRHDTTAYSKALAELRGTDSGSAVQFFAPVHLPHGATVTGLEAQIYDNDATQNINLSLGFVNSGSGVGGMASLASTGSQAAVRTLSTTTITQGATIDNQYRSYHVSASWTVPATSFNIKLHRVVVTYTTQDGLP